MAVKYITLAIPAVGAGVVGPRVVIPTVGDDNKSKKVTGFKCSNTTKGMTLTLDSNSVGMQVIDLAVLGQVTDMLDCEYTVDANIQLSFSINNTTGGALTAGDFITLRYTT